MNFFLFGKITDCLWDHGRRGQLGTGKKSSGRICICRSARVLRGPRLVILPGFRSAEHPQGTSFLSFPPTSQTWSEGLGSALPLPLSTWVTMTRHLIPLNLTYLVSKVKMLSLPSKTNECID